MVRRLFKLSRRADLHFFALVALAWLGLSFPMAFVLGEALHVALALGVLGTVVALLVLNILGYFDPLRVFPRRSDVFLMLTAMPVSVLAQFLVLSIGLGGIPSTSAIMPVIVSSLFLAALLFSLHYRLSRGLVRYGARKKIVLDVSPEERAALDKEYMNKGMSSYIQFLSINDLRRHIIKRRAQEISLIVLSTSTTRKFDVDAVLVRAHLSGLPILDFPTVLSRLSGRVDLNNACLWSYLMEARPQTKLLLALAGAKTLMEPVLAAVMALLLAPVMLVIALAVKLTSPGPVLYRQTRVGYLGRTFSLIKFRSMVVNAESEGKAQWAKENDSRMTAIGHILRRTRLDELPQLWNVMKGEMSFVGPRPERPEIYAELKKEIPLFPVRLVVRPGITGWAQVYAGYAASVEESRLKLEYDLFYIQNFSPRLDLAILFKTLWITFFGEPIRLPKEAKPTAMVGVVRA